jgi:hypothetical protein
MEDSMSETNQTPNAGPSKTRVIGATVAGAVVAVVLGSAANIGIGKLAAMTQNKINPPTVNNEN